MSKRNRIMAHRLRQLVASKMGTKSSTYQWVRSELRKGVQPSILIDQLKNILSEK